MVWSIIWPDDFRRSKGSICARDKLGVAAASKRAAEKAHDRISSPRRPNIQSAVHQADAWAPKHMTMKLTAANSRGLGGWNLVQKNREPCRWRSTRGLSAPRSNEVFRSSWRYDGMPEGGRRSSKRCSEGAAQGPVNRMRCRGRRCDPGRQLLQGVTSRTCCARRVTPLSLGIETRGGDSRGSSPQTIIRPKEEPRGFSTRGQSNAVKIRVFQGEREGWRRLRCSDQFDSSEYHRPPRGVRRVDGDVDHDCQSAIVKSRPRQGHGAKKSSRSASRRRARPIRGDISEWQGCREPAEEDQKRQGRGRGKNHAVGARSIPRRTRTRRRCTATKVRRRSHRPRDREERDGRSPRTALKGAMLRRSRSKTNALAQAPMKLARPCTKPTQKVPRGGWSRRRRRLRVRTDEVVGRGIH